MPAEPSPPHWRPWLVVMLLGLTLQALAWPLAWRLVVLPEAQAGRQGFLCLEYDCQEPSGRPRQRGFRAAGPLELERPDISLLAYAVWRVASPGYYHLRLQCDDYGSLALDGREALRLTPATAALNQGEARVFLEAGSHLLGLRLVNGPGRGWLRLEATVTGGEPAPLPAAELSYIDLDNLPAWLGGVDLARAAGLGLALAALLGLLWGAAPLAPLALPWLLLLERRFLARPWPWVCCWDFCCSSWRSGWGRRPAAGPCAPTRVPRPRSLASGSPPSPAAGSPGPAPC